MSSLFRSSIAKKDCPGGQHSHFNARDCHDINTPHSGKGANDWHKAHGFVTWEETHNGKSPKERGGKKPEGKKPEGKEPEGKKPEEKKPEEKKPEEESGKDGEIKPYDEGLEKPESLKYVLGFTREEIRKSNTHYEKAEKDAKVIVDSLRSVDWSDDSKSNNEKVNSALRKIQEETGITYRRDFNFDEYDVDCVKETFECLADCFTDYPMAIYGFGGFSETARGVESYSPSSMTINFNHRYFGRDGNPFDDKPVEGVIDPVTKSDDVQWSFHFNGSTYSNSVSHEFGHAVDFMLRSMRYTAGERPERDKDNSEKTYEFTDEQRSQVEELLNGEDYEYGLVDIQKGWSDSEYFVYVEDYDRYSYPEVQAKLKKIKGISSAKLYMSNQRSIAPYMFVIKVRPKKGEKTKVDRVKGNKWDEELEKKNLYIQYGQKQREEQDQFAVERVKECEEVYKKLYGVKTIIPSEVYSIYGYYGVSEYDNGSKSKTKERNSGERLAEAYNDVIVRKGKANSMSQLLVAHSEFEYYQVMTGDYDMTFEDFIFKKIGKEKFIPRITKMRYITKHMIGN